MADRSSNWLGAVSGRSGRFAQSRNGKKGGESWSR
jgi:hypothetical protein